MIILTSLWQVVPLVSIPPTSSIVDDIGLPRVVTVGR